MEEGQEIVNHGYRSNVKDHAIKHVILNGELQNIWTYFKLFISVSDPKIVLFDYVTQHGLFIIPDIQ